MKFSEIIDQASELLQRKGRLTYRSLKLEFDLDDARLDVLKDELIKGQRLAADEDGTVLVWVGDGNASVALSELSSQPPASYTPQHLAERILAEQAAMESRGSANGERKTITALFADLKGSTALIEGLDPEDARAIIDPALQLMMDAVHRYDGYVAQALGDGIFALFGAPLAHEDHPQRALYAALRMQDEMRRYSDKLREEGAAPLQIRVGVNTGEVVVRSIRKDDLHADYVPVGHSTNIAARMEQLANPGSILVTEQTYKLTDGYFAFTALGQTKVKGIEEPVSIYEVVGAGPLRTRFQVTSRRGLTRFVGRHGELDQLQRALEQAKSGRGQIVGVMGEPGLGKSRLFYEFKLTSQIGCLVLEAFSVSHGKASPYLPLIELLKTYFDIEPPADARKRREKVTGKVLTLDRSLEETLPYLFALLDIEEDHSHLQQMDAQIRRQRTFEALKKLFLRESLNQVLVLLFEDLHWVDSETQGFLEVLSESVGSAPVLLLVNYRPEYRHEWGQKTYYTQLRLAPLGKAEVDELLTFLLGTDTSLTALRPLILAKTEGTPFFLEEVVQTLVEEGVLAGERGNYHLETPLTELHIPSTVQGVLAARIDRLTAEEKALLQHLSVIGRQFPLSLVKQVVVQPEAELYRLLASLQGKEFLYEQPAFPEVEYLFKHALTQDVAYGTLLQKQRKALHERTGQALETLHKENLEDHYGELAHHYGRSENAAKAVAYLSLAGQQAVQHSAHGEAVRYLSSALELLHGLPRTSERDQQELTLQVMLGAPLVAMKGFSAPEVETVYSRARELCEQIGALPRLFPVLSGLWSFHHMRAELETARSLGEQGLRLAAATQNSLILAGAHQALGATLSFLGTLPAARAHLEQTRTLYDAQPQQFGLDASVENLGVGSRSHLARLLWLLGYPDQALAVGAQALALAREQVVPASLALALTFTGWCHELRREGPRAQDRAEELIALSAEQGFAFHLETGRLFLGRALVQQGHSEEGLDQFQQGWAAQEATGTRLNRPYNLAFLAEANGQADRAGEGLSLVTEGLDAVARTGETWWEAELYRLHGELTLLANRSSPESRVEREAEASFQQALNVARRQEAKSLELRATTCLARLWQQQGKRAEARELLAPLYGWFTEGFATADLKAAQALLTELSEAV